jgi:hypothetical protein
MTLGHNPSVALGWTSAPPKQLSKVFRYFLRMPRNTA